MSLGRRLALVAVAIVVAVIAGFGIAQRMGGRDVALPDRIVVSDRTYKSPVTVGDAAANTGSGEWRQVGVMETSHQPIFAWVIPGAAATVVFVQLTPSTYVEYSLQGGP